MKQETLEEAINREFPLDNSYKEREAMFIGAKWQQEQDKNKYSEEEVIKLFKKIIKYDAKWQQDLKQEIENL